MPATVSAREEAQRFFEFFCARGASPFDTDILQPAESLLDLYGEDIRGRAFVTEDSARGELMLRPDFTVPLAKYHMESAAESASYAYRGPVFRRQWPGSSRPREYLQAGYELFGGNDSAEAEAEIFAAFHEALKPLGLRPATGDLSLLIAAVEGLTATDSQKASLKRHIWRPDKFRRMLDHLRQDRSGCADPSFTEQLIRERSLRAGPEIGQRSVSEVVENMRAKNSESLARALDPGELAAIDEILLTKDRMGQAVRKLRYIAGRMRGIASAVDGLEARMNALSRKGIAAEDLSFEASYGRTSLEYYDGFVFGFFHDRYKQPAALGGRYDFLTKALGRGRSCPAVGGMVRPEMTAALRCGPE